MIGGEGTTLVLDSDKGAVIRLRLHHPAESNTITSGLKGATSLCVIKDKIAIGTSSGIK